jgi:hypothetical protein
MVNKLKSIYQSVTNSVIPLVGGLALIAYATTNSHAADKPNLNSGFTPGHSVSTKGDLDKYFDGSTYRLVIPGKVVDKNRKYTFEESSTYVDVLTFDKNAGINLRNNLPQNLGKLEFYAIKSLDHLDAIMYELDKSGKKIPSEIKDFYRKVVSSSENPESLNNLELAVRDGYVSHKEITGSEKPIVDGYYLVLASEPNTKKREYTAGNPKQFNPLVIKIARGETKRDEEKGKKKTLETVSDDLRGREKGGLLEGWYGSLGVGNSGVEVGAGYRTSGLCLNGVGFGVYVAHGFNREVASGNEYFENEREVLFTPTGNTKERIDETSKDTKTTRQGSVKASVSFPISDDFKLGVDAGVAFLKKEILETRSATISIKRNNELLEDPVTISKSELTDEQVLEYIGGLRVGYRLPYPGLEAFVSGEYGKISGVSGGLGVIYNF